MRKSQREAQERREQREQMREQLQELERKERQEMQEEQRYARYMQRISQKARRKANATTRAGGKREGAGRPPKDGQERRTFTFYGSYHEREQVRNFLRVLRASDPQRAYTLFLELNGVSMYELLTSGDITDPAQRKIIAAEMPELLGGEE